VKQFDDVEEIFLLPVPARLAKRPEAAFLQLAEKEHLQVVTGGAGPIAIYAVGPEDLLKVSSLL
jgi:hypothetical protein